VVLPLVEYQVPEEAGEGSSRRPPFSRTRATPTPTPWRCKLPRKTTLVMYLHYTGPKARVGLSEYVEHQATRSRTKYFDVDTAENRDELVETIAAWIEARLSIADQERARTLF
jgi:hypothetical protein